MASVSSKPNATVQVAAATPYGITKIPERVKTHFIEKSNSVKEKPWLNMIKELESQRKYSIENMNVVQ